MCVCVCVFVCVCMCVHELYLQKIVCEHEEAHIEGLQGIRWLNKG